MRHPWCRPVFPCLSMASLLMACLLSACATTAPAERAPGQPRVIGYVSDAAVLPPVSADKLDVINFAFAHVTPGHEVVLVRPTAARSLRTLTALRKRNPSLRILLSIGGWGAGNFSEAALDDASRARFARSAVALVARHRLDGLDIDWEYPTRPGPGISHRPEDRQNFTLLLRAVRSELDALPATKRGRYLLTIAAADGEAASGLELAQIAQVLDWINLMTYDFHGSLSPTTGHQAGLHRSASAPADSRNAEHAVEEFLAAGVPAAKLHLGLAFYGRRFADVVPENNGLYQRFGSDGGYVSWQGIARDHLDKGGFVRLWDPQAQAAWLWNAAERRLISYDDPQALRAKAAFVRQRGLGGVMYWEHGNDPEEQLLDVVRAALLAPAPLQSTDPEPTTAPDPAQVRTSP